MKLLLIYWAFLILGYAAASWIRRKSPREFTRLPALMMVTIYGLCFVMGLRMGVNEQVTSNLGVIGLKALVITIFCVAGSMLAIFAARKLLGMDRYGTVKGKAVELVAETAAEPVAGEIETPEAQTDAGPSGEEADSSSMDIRSTIILLSVVAAGMVIGAFILAPRGEAFLDWFDDRSNLTMVVLLCGLMLLVGFDMGHSGMVVEYLKAAGLRVMVFPLAAMVGTMVFGIGACLILGLTLRESAAIPLGFGWYSYAPIVIAEAGQQFMVASAISFMHNVIREVSGIIFIPLAAKKIGYLEATGIPGIAAMDICMPIVARSCRGDTVIYSFAIGFIMCIVTSIGVPLVMGV